MKTSKVVVTFKFEVGSVVYYDDEAYFVISRNYMETLSGACIVKYNLRKKFDEDVFLPNVWESELKYRPTPPLRIIKWSLV